MADNTILDAAIAKTAEAQQEEAVSLKSLAEQIGRLTSQLSSLTPPPIDTGVTAPQAQSQTAQQPQVPDDDLDHVDFLTKYQKEKPFDPASLKSYVIAKNGLSGAEADEIVDNTMDLMRKKCNIANTGHENFVRDVEIEVKARAMVVETEKAHWQESMIAREAEKRVDAIMTFGAKDNGEEAEKMRRDAIKNFADAMQVPVEEVEHLPQDRYRNILQKYKDHVWSGSVAVKAQDERAAVASILGCTTSDIDAVWNKNDKKH